MLKYVSVILSLILNAYPINFLWGFIVGENVSFHCNKIKHLLNTEGVQLKYLEAAHYQATATVRGKAALSPDCSTQGVTRKR